MASSESSENPIRKKVKLCQDYISSVKGCYWGEMCFYPHQENELEAHPNNAVAWLQDIGVSEILQRQFGIINEKNCLNVTCNRNTCLGNPFINALPTYEKLGPNGYCVYCFRCADEGEECYCLTAENHVELCDAFQDYFALVLKTVEDELDLEARALAEMVARRRTGLLISRRWAWHAFSRRSILRAFQTLQNIYTSFNVRIVLLCHCGVAVDTKPCHAAIIQQHLVRLSSRKSQNLEVGAEKKCDHCHRDWLWRGSLDAEANKFYCALCWCVFSDKIYEAELRYPLPDAPLLQPLED